MPVSMNQYCVEEGYFRGRDRGMEVVAFFGLGCPLSDGWKVLYTQVTTTASVHLAYGDHRREYTFHY